MTVSLVKYAINKQIIPPVRGNVARFLNYSSIIHEKGWKPDERIHTESEYSNIQGSEIS